MRHDEETSKRFNGSQQIPAPLWAWLGLGAAALAALVVGAVAMKAFTSPTSGTQNIERARYEQDGAFDYTVVGPASSLYPDGRVGPVSAPPKVNGVAADVEAPPIFTKLSQSIETGFRYTVSGIDTGGLAGTIGADLQIKAAGGGGWTRVQTLVPPAPFQGSEAAVRGVIELAPIQAMIDTIEKETGFTASSYELTVIPRVQARATVNGEPVELNYAPPFTFKYTKTNITPDATLQQSQPATIGSTVSTARHLSLGLFSPPISTARWLSMALGTLALVSGGALASVVFLGLGQDETVKARLRYHTTMVNVSEADHNGSQRVRVATIQDLARVANRDGGVIFTQKVEDGDLYFVPDGAVTYEYTAANGAGISRGANTNGSAAASAPLVHASNGGPPPRPEA